MPHRLTGSNKTYLLLEYLDKYFKNIDKANNAIDQMDTEKGREPGHTRTRTIEYLKSRKNKSSEEEREGYVTSVTGRFADDVPVYTAEAGGDVDVPAEMGGKVLLRIFTKSRDRFIKAVDSELTMEKCVLAEIRARSISISEGDLRSMNLAEKRKKIRKNEFDSISSERRELTEDKVKDFTPKSDEMKHFISSEHKV